MYNFIFDVSSIWQWIKKNWDAIGAGIVASIIVLFLQTSVKSLVLVSAAWANKTLILLPLWGFSSATRFYIVSGSIAGVTQEVRNAILVGPDADAANEAMVTTRLLRPKAELSKIYSPNYPDELLKENIISVGGPVNNSVTKKLMSSIKNIVDFEDFALHDKITNTYYEAEYDTDDTIINDYGLILKLPNPLGYPTEILILAGCDSHGVLASARAISLHRDGKPTLLEIRRKMGIFAQFKKNFYMAIVCCKATGNEISNIELIAFHALRSDGKNIKAK